MRMARLSLQIASVPFANCKRALLFVKAFTLFSLRITHPGVAKGWQGLPRVGSGCQGLAELPRSAKGWQRLPSAAGAAKGWQGLSAVFPTMPGILISRSLPCAFQSQTENEKNETALMPRREESQTLISA